MHSILFWYAGCRNCKQLKTRPFALQVISGNPRLTGKGSLLEKLGMQTAAAAFRRGIQFEGVKFVLGDFVLFVAQATNIAGSKEFLGVVAELEYSPLPNFDVAQPVLEVCIFLNES